MKTRIIPFYLAPLLLCGAAQAGTHNWNGLGASNNWSTVANWSSGGAPFANETAVNLLFPNGAFKPANVCNIPGLSAESIILNGSGYTLTGTIPITLTGASNTLYSAGTNNYIGMPLVLASPNLNFGQGTGASLQVAGVISGSGGFKKIGRGDLSLVGSSNNTFTGTTTVLGGKLRLKKDGTKSCFSGPLIIGDTAGSAVGGGPDSIVLMEGEQQMPFGTPLTVNPDGRFEMYVYSAAIGSLTMVGNGLIDGILTSTLTLFGDITASLNPNDPNSYADTAIIYPDLSLGGATRTIIVTGNLGIYGDISSGGGNAGIIKNGVGGLFIRGNHTYSGDTIINQGGFSVYGNSPDSNIYMKAGTEISGSATVGSVQCIGTRLIPEIYSGYGQQPTVNFKTKNLSLDSASTFDLFIDDEMVINQDLVTVLGTVNLGGCELKSEIEFTASYNPAVGSKFRIINNDLADPVLGTFKDLPEGASFKFSGRRWTITYKGGDGNDVVLTLASGQLPFSLDKITLGTGGSYTILTGNGTPGDSTYRMQSSPDLIVWTDKGGVGNSNGNLTAITNDFPSHPKYFYRFIKPAMGP